MVILRGLLAALCNATPIESGLGPAAKLRDSGHGVGHDDLLGACDCRDSVYHQMVDPDNQQWKSF